MDVQEAKTRHTKLEALVAHHQALYHEKDTPQISDEAYDALVRELRGIETEFPELKQHHSVSERVGGAPLEAFRKVRHEVRQWSFGNIFSFEELCAWHEKLARYITRETQYDANGFSYCAEQKIDGLKIILTYTEGALVLGTTRGDGEVGEDITQNLRTIQSIPLTLSQPLNIIVGGEAWLSHPEFARINVERKKNNESLFANPRNAAAGSLRQLDSRITASRNLDCFIYDIEQIEGAKMPETQTEELEFLASLGFHVNSAYAHCTSVDDIEAFYTKSQKERTNAPFDMDGLVLKVNERSYQDVLGYTAHGPRFAIAYKFPAEQTTTIIKDIVLQVGRTGVLTPVAELEPVLVAGSVVSRATLHNEDQIQRLDIRVGDTVIIQKAGDVIPEVVSVMKELRTGKEKAFRFPKKVSTCGGDGSIERVPGQSAWRCVYKNSYEQTLRRLEHFVSKKALNIDGMGPRIVNLLLEEERIATYADIFTLEPGDLEGLPGFKEKAVRNVLDAIDKARTVSLPKLLFGLSIDQVGEETARDIAEHFGSLERIREATKEELEDVEGVGPIVASSVYAWFRDEAHIRDLDALLPHVTITTIHTQKRRGVFAGKKIVVTGTLKRFSREEVKELIREEGGSTVASVSKQTDIVLAGSAPGSKVEKAKTLGVPVMDEVTFLKRIGL